MTSNNNRIKRMRLTSGDQLISYEQSDPDNIGTNSMMTRLTANDSNNRKSLSSFEIFPNEILFLILSYLNTSDIFQSFYGLNEHLNNVVVECTRHINLLDNKSSEWLDEHMPHIEHRIETISLYDNVCQNVFREEWSFANLQLIYLVGDGWETKLVVNNESPQIVLQSSLNVLETSDLNTEFCFTSTLDCIDETTDNNLIESLCPFIERLSIDSCSLEGLIKICTRTPNLIYLKISRLIEFEHDVYLPDEINRIKPITRLATLNITRCLTRNLDQLEQVLSSFQSSLKRLTLHFRCSAIIDGHRLESIFKPYRQLEKLVFCIELVNNEIETGVYLRSFQSKWWLDACRPLIFVQHNDENNTIIATMPCYLSDSFMFTNDPKKWYLNKGELDSSHVRFSNINQLSFCTKSGQLFTLEFLYFVDRVFTSQNQTFRCNYCDLEAVDILFDMLMEDTTMTPVLPNVIHFIVASENKFNPLMLGVWILLAPNMRTLDLAMLTTFDKIEFAYDLSVMLENEKYESLKPHFDRIVKLIIFPKSDNADKNAKHELSTAFKKVFTKAVIN